jgi:nucleoside-diphosphate kinase
VAKYCMSPLDTWGETVRLPDVKRTLVIIKPDGVERGLVGEILSRLERKQLRIVAGELRTIDVATASEHYAEHVGKPFYDALVSFITRGPSLVLIVEGPEDTWKVVRTLMGATNPVDAAPGTIRGDLAIVMAENLIHGSDSAESADREIKIFFDHLN